MIFYNNTTNLLPDLQVTEDIFTACNQELHDLTGFIDTQIIRQTLSHKLKNIQYQNKLPISVSELIILQKKQKAPIRCSAIIDNDTTLLPVTFNIDVSNDPNNNYFLYFQPITRKNFDPITNLPNGQAMRSRAKELTISAQNNGTQLIILILNIDNFSTINYRYGFEIGDAYLERVGQAIKGIAAPYLTVRYANAKFGILIENQSQFSLKQFQRHAAKLSKKLCKLSQTAFLINKTISITKSFSIGISPQFNDFKNYHSIEIAAETAMISEQKTYVSGYNFADSSDISSLTYEKLIIDSLPNALLQHQIEVFYQPQYCIETKKVVGFEALSRWQHETLGNIPPNIFIEISEKIGLHLEFDLWVFQKVCSQIVTWLNEQHTPPRVAINISFKTAELTSFIPRINEVIKTTNCPIGLIEIEITETAAIKNEPMLIKNIQTLKKLGYSIAIDDFGSGYSSLSLLRKLQPYLDKVKLDKSLIDNLCCTEIDRGVVKQIIKLGKLMELEVLAEGVENEEQLSILNQLNCNSVQGFYFNKALSAKKAIASLQ